MIEPQHYVFPKAHFDAIAKGEGNAETVRVLREGLQNRWLMMLRTIIEMVASETLDQAIDLLSRARERDNEQVLRMIDYPYVQAWAQACTEQAMGFSSSKPLDAHLDYFAAFAATAAFRVGLEDFRIDVTIRDGRVFLPAMGCVVFPEHMNGEQATISIEGGTLFVEQTNLLPGAIRVTVPKDSSCDALDWMGIRTLQTQCGDHRLELAFDDLDPYRLQRETWLEPEQRVQAEDFMDWQKTLREAWEYLCEHHASYVPMMAAGLQVLTPLRIDPYTAFTKAPYGFGAVMSTKPTGSFWLEFGLLHEFQRAKLAALHLLLPLHKASNDDYRHYSPWFPVSAVSLQGIFEALYCTPAAAEYWETARKIAPTEGDKTEASLVSALWRSWFLSTAEEFSRTGEFTDWGTRVFEQLPEKMNATQFSPIASVQWDTARHVSTDRWISWRLRNFLPSYKVLQQLAAAWVGGKSCPVGVEFGIKVEPRENLDSYTIRRRLLRLKYQDPAAFDQLLEHPEELVTFSTSATHADVVLISGDFQTAETLYQEAIEGDPHDAEPWPGWIWAQRQSRPNDLVTIALQRSPELVHQLYKTLSLMRRGTISPLEVATWVTPLLLALDEREINPNDWEWEIDNERSSDNSSVS